MDIDVKSAVDELMKINHIEKISMDQVPIKKKIGEGGQARVYKGEYEGNQVAVKVLSNIDYKCFAHELVIMANLTHNHIPKFYGIVAEEKVLSLVFEFIDGKTLDEVKIRELPTTLKYTIIKDLASLLEYIHENKFIHRDLKPENLMLDVNQKIYLIDFGIAKVCTKEGDYTDTRAKGTVYYLAPECLDVASVGEDEQIISRINSKVDVWAYGCIVSWLFSGKLPWRDKYPDNPAVIQQVLTEKKPFSIPSKIKDEVVKNVIKMATVVDPNERSTMAEIRAYLEESGK